VDELIAELEANGVREMWLVTIDAASFFSRAGFVARDREDVPSAVRASPEFAMHACARGTWMSRGRR
jgi:N-acetylglutamate synthase-like GNAT family acetyltransferase